KRVLHDYGIRTVITLRDAYNKGEPPPDLAEEEYCLKEEISYVRLSPASWWASDGSVPAEANVRRFLDVMRQQKNYPVLIHCFAGTHRTGAYCALYRMEFQKWSNAEALHELRANGYANLDDEWDLLGYLERYQPAWKKNTEAVTADRNVSYYPPARVASKA